MTLPPIYDESSFQVEVVKRLLGCKAHVQVLDEAPRSLGVPDLSVAHTGHEYWLELKYEEFRSGGSIFKLKYMRRAQVDWLCNRYAATNGRSWCGFLIFYKLGVMLPYREYVCYIPIADYMNFVMGDKCLVDPVIIHQYSMPWLSDLPGENLLQFIRETMHNPEAPASTPVSTSRVHRIS